MTTLSFEFLKTELTGGQRARIDSYLNSALYYLITGRKGAWLYKGQHSVLVVCQHPHIEDRLLVFPEVGKADYELTASVLNMLEPPKNGVQLARYSEEEITALRQQLAKLNYTTVLGVSTIEEDVLDWRYPVHILDANIVAEMKGANFARIRNKFRIAAKNITHIPLRPNSALRLMRAALKFWEGTMIAGEKDTQGMSDFYIELFKIMEAHPETIRGLFFKQKRRPVGFSVWDTPTDDTANLLVSLGDTSVTGLSDFQLVSTCRQLRDEGVKHVNMGGSELETLDAFKAKYKPVKTVKVFSAEVAYRQPDHPHIEQHIIVPEGQSL